VRLVAVSKYKPADNILSLFSAAKHEHFGENYVQELLEKSEVVRECKAFEDASMLHHA
jgi:uncharacterized pyridoxal phosphate-containing UPF0001 family protein